MRVQKYVKNKSPLLHRKSTRCLTHQPPVAWNNHIFTASNKRKKEHTNARGNAGSSDGQLVESRIAAVNEVIQLALNIIQ